MMAGAAAARPWGRPLPAAIDTDPGSRVNRVLRMRCAAISFIVSLLLSFTFSSSPSPTCSFSSFFFLCFRAFSLFFVTVVCPAWFCCAAVVVVVVARLLSRSRRFRFTKGSALNLIRNDPNGPHCTVLIDFFLRFLFTQKKSDWANKVEFLFS